MKGQRLNQRMQDRCSRAVYVPLTETHSRAETEGRRRRGGGGVPVPSPPVVFQSSLRPVLSGSPSTHRQDTGPGHRRSSATAALPGAFAQTTVSGQRPLTPARDQPSRVPAQPVTIPSPSVEDQGLKAAGEREGEG